MWRGKGELNWTSEVLTKPRDRHKMLQFLPGKPLSLPRIEDWVPDFAHHFANIPIISHPIGYFQKSSESLTPTVAAST